MTPAEVLRAVNEMAEPVLDGPAVRGKYAHIFRTFPLVEIDPDLHEAFPSAAHVNEGLRVLLRIVGETAGLAAPASTRRRRKKQAAPNGSL
jgi:hypothetical protein